MKILIIGFNGQLGTELCMQAFEKGLVTAAVDTPDFDLTDKAMVEDRLAESKPDLVINAAAYTAVDQAESEVGKAFAVNRDGPAYLASACAREGTPLIHISTDYVFDGTKQGPYLESDPVNPAGVYGKSKAEGETEVRARLTEHIILRTSWLYGVAGYNFVHTMLRLGKEREVLRVVNDQRGCPTFAADLAQAVLDIASILQKKDSQLWGTYHYCGEGETSWYGFAKEIFEFAQPFEEFKLTRLVPIPTAEFPTAAKRPANSVMDCSQLKGKFGISRKPWQESLAAMLERLYKKREKGDSPAQTRWAH